MRCTLLECYVRADVSCGLCIKRVALLLHVSVVKTMPIAVIITCELAQAEVGAFLLLQVARQERG